MGTVLVLAALGVFYAVGRSEDREREREAHAAAPAPPRDAVKRRVPRPDRPRRRRDHD